METIEDVNDIVSLWLLTLEKQVKYFLKLMRELGTFFQIKIHARKF